MDNSGIYAVDFQLSPNQKSKREIHIAPWRSARKLQILI